MAQTDSDDATQATPPAWPGWLIATATCIRFYSRLPVPRLPGERDAHAPPDFRTVPRALPFAALFIAVPAALVLFGAGSARLGGLLSAALALAVLAVTTGALHEDGLADSADGLFGGRTIERRLEIMKDSRLGSYGASALAFSILLRVSALAVILDRAGPETAAGVLLVAATLSRLSGVHLLATLPPARADGASVSVGRPSKATAEACAGVGVTLSLVILFALSLPWWGWCAGIALCEINKWLVKRLCRTLLGGQTGDIAGATQQLDELAVYLGFALAVGLAWS